MQEWRWDVMGRRMGSATPRLLLVEDEDHLATALKLNLELEGFAVDVAQSARRVRELLLAPEPYNAIVLDVMLPDVDGLSATRELKQDALTRAIPVIAVTAQAMAGDAERAHDAGCADYVSKPIDSTRLLRAIQQVTDAVA